MNTFTKPIYAPMLKWRSAEQSALRDLEKNTKDCILPIIEIVPSKPRSNVYKTPYEELETESIERFMNEDKDQIPKKISKSWGQRHIVVDLTLLYPLRLKLAGLDSVVDGITSENLNISIVVNISDENEYLTALKNATNKINQGYCFRITQHDLKDIEGTNKRLRKLLSELKTKSEQSILLIDLKDDFNNKSYKDVLANSNSLIDINSWKHFIVSSGSFPSDLGECRVEEDNLIERHDLKNWLASKEIVDGQRRPMFSDYAIRHPIYMHSYTFYTPTPSPKYTLKKSWWVIKGRKTSKKDSAEEKRLKRLQYLAGAETIVNSERYYSAEYSAGDKFISDKSTHFKEIISDQLIKVRPGNAEQWISAGINHHLTLTADQVSSSL